MKKESLNLAKQIILDALLGGNKDSKKINEIDKLEICWNISYFLDNYETNVKTLKDKGMKERKR